MRDGLPGKEDDLYKVLVADDESIILNGIKNCIDWGLLGMEVVATASDGEQALEAIERLNPDLCLLDVHMPFVDGLTVAKLYLKRRPDGIVLFITGYDEFSYAQAAVNTGAIGYILKPVDEEELLCAVKKASELMESRRRVDLLIYNNLDTLREIFFHDWLSGITSSKDAKDNLTFYGICLKGEVAVLFVRFYKDREDEFLSGKALQKDMDLIKQEILMLVDRFCPYFLMRPADKTIVVVHSILGDDGWIDFPLRLGDKLDDNGIHAEILHRQVESMEDVPAAYREMDEKTNLLERLSPIVRLLKQYIDQNYKNPVMSLKSFAKAHKTTSSYISRQFKQEMGQSFVDYLTFVRISMSIPFLKKPHIKIFEIAEFVGYNSQHYYCEVFKQKMGITPSEYRQKFL